MPSFDFDNHTLCTKCRNQVCDLELVCDECRDWPLPKRKVFVNYNNSLRARREYKKRKARLAGAASDQSVYDTDTDVPLDEPSVPMQNVHFDSVGQQQCLVSEEVVVSSAPSTEVAQSDVLLLSSGDGLDKLAASIFSRLSDLQSAKAPPPPQYRVIHWGVELVSLVLFCLVSVSLVLLIPILLGSLPPLNFYLTLCNQFSGFPQRLCLAKPLIGLSPAIIGSSSCRRNLLPLVRRSPRFAIVGFVLLSRSLTRPHRYPGIWRMLGNRLHGLGFRHLPSLRLSSLVLLVQSSTLLSLVHLGDVPLTRLSILWDTPLARGVILLPARDVGSLAIRLMMRTHRLKFADNGTISRTKRTIFVLPH